MGRLRPRPRARPARPRADRQEREGRAALPRSACGPDRLQRAALQLTPMPFHDFASYATRTLDDATIPELPNHYRGKVRDNYDLADGRRVIIASDRLSAFDRILCSVPFKGELLTRTARFWFDETAHICRNHVLDYPDPNVLLCRRLDILPVEIVVRGYLAGTTGTSILTLYKRGQRAMYGMTLPD